MLQSKLRCLALLLVLSCGDNDVPPANHYELAGLEIDVYSRPARLVVRDGELILFDGLPGKTIAEGDQEPAVAMAMRSAEARIQFLFGSFHIEEQFKPDEFDSVRSFGIVSETDSQLQFDLQARSGAVLGSAKLIAAGDGELIMEFEAAGDQNRMSMAFGCNAEEHFIGMGGQSFDVDHRGQTVPIWVQEDGIQKSEEDNYSWGNWYLNGRRHSTHTPMPMYVSSRGYGLALDTSRRSLFAFCSEREDVVRIEAWDSKMSLRLFRADTPLAIVEKMTAWTGRPARVPAFTFAPWLDAVHGEDNVRRIATALRAARIPGSVIWSEDWRGGNDEALGYTLEEDWYIDRELYPNVEVLATELHAAGFKFFNYHNSFVDTTADVYDEVISKDYGIHDSEGAPYLFDGVKLRKTTLLDLSNVEAFEWAKQVYKESLQLGFDGYMADFAEWLPHDAVLASGEDPMAAHNLYPVEWQRLNKELFDEMFDADGIERLFFVRSAYMGSQPLVSVVWAGDQQTDFSIGDGLPSIVPMGIGLGITGFPYYGHDIAGYMSEFTLPTSKELFFRWTTLGALSPVMRTHHGRSARENWNWESDAETTEHFRFWAALHMQLYPYLSELGRQAHATGAPLFRPLALDYPDFELGWTSVDQFMLGDRIIVAPILSEAAVSRSVSLPPGRFYPLLGGPAVEGDFTAEAGLADIPAFVPAGTLLVLLPESVETLTVEGDDSVVTLQDAGSDRVLWVYPDGDSTWQEEGALQYQWIGSTSSGNPGAATFGGADVALAPGSNFLEVQLTGPGTLVFDDGSSLIIEGGEADRNIVVRLYSGN